MYRGSKTIGLLSHALCAVSFFVLIYRPAFAAAPSVTPTPATSSATITATVPEQSFNPPMLITPANNTITNQPKISFSWRRPSPVPVTPLNHYDLYLDDNLFAQGLPDGMTTTLDFYFYTARRDVDRFFLDLKENIAEGYHHWRVVAYNDTGLSSESETWTFYVDSISPNIKLLSADTNKLNWNSADLSTIPTEDKRYLYVTQDPLLTGEVEPYANLQFTLLCPYGVVCTGLTETFNYPSGRWANRFYGLIPNKTYTVILSSTDAANNSVIFPRFYLIYLSGPAGARITPGVPPTVTPPIAPPISPTITLPSPTSITLPPTLNEIFIPAEFLPVPPTAPAPPPIISAPPVTEKPFDYQLLLWLLLIFGLPLHLAMTQFGKAVKFEDTYIFLPVLIFPFFFKKKNRTYPFTTITLYDPRNLNITWQQIISDINGYYFLKDRSPEELFIKSYSFNRLFNSNIIKTSIFAQSCLYLMPKGRENALERLQHSSYGMRQVPLIIAILTSSISLYFFPSYFALIYLYLSLQCVFSEYIYPKIVE